MSRDNHGDSTEEIYRTRSQHFAVEAQRFGRHDGKLALARGLTFLAGAACLFMAYLDANVRPVWVAGGSLLLLAFLTLAIVDDWLKRQAEHMSQLRQVNDWQLARRLRQWQSYRYRRPPFRRVTLRLPRISTCSAALRYSSWSASPTRHAVSPCCATGFWTRRNRARSCSVRQRSRELTPELETARRIDAEGAHAGCQPCGSGSIRHVGGRETSPGATALDQMDIAPAAGARNSWRSPDSPAATLSANTGATLIILMLVLNVLFSVAYTGSVHDIFDNISTRSGEMRHYLALFELISQIPATSRRLQEIQQHAVKEEHGALHQLLRLRLIMKLANLRHDSLLSILYFGLQATVLWDFHVLYLLERWQRRCHHLVRQWFDALAELEALCSLSGLAFDHPDWCFPQLVDSGWKVVRGEGIGHPLLSDAARVVERRGSRARRDGAAGDRFEHVGQEHAVAIDRRQRTVGRSRGPGVCAVAADASC